MTALQALRGVALAVATEVMAEIGDIRRFDNPRQLMAYLGLVPGERSSGERRRPTSITKAGSIVARKLIVEAAWAYRMPAKVGQGSVGTRGSPGKFVPSLGRRQQKLSAFISSSCAGSASSARAEAVLHGYELNRAPESGASPPYPAHDHHRLDLADCLG